MDRRVLCSLRTTAAAVEFLGGPQESNNEIQEDCDRDRLVVVAGLLGEGGTRCRKWSVGRLGGSVDSVHNIIIIIIYALYNNI